MSMNRQSIADEELVQVVGGLFEFYKKSKYVKYTHPDGTVTQHTLLNYDKAWEMCCNLEAQKMNENKICQQMIDSGYIAP